MEENPLLLRLKELESLERLVEKVGRIDLHAGDGQGFDALLTKLVRLKPAERMRDRKGRPRAALHLLFWPCGHDFRFRRCRRLWHADCNSEADRTVVQ
jgi:hypothetical protein